MKGTKVGITVLLLMALSLAACSGKKENNGSSANGSSQSASQSNSGGSSNTVSGMFGEYGISDEDIAIDGVTFELNEGYNKVNKNRTQALALFPNWDDAACKAAFPDYAENLKNAVAKIDPDMTIVTDSEKRFDAYYKYGGKKAYIITNPQSAQIQLEISWQ
jgi:hypothetical protein